MADLVSGRFPQLNPWWNMLGQPTNVVQADIPARSNLEYLGLGGGLTDSAAASGATILASGVMTAVPVPVDVGTVISKISILTGATAASTPTHSFGALYSGTNVAAPPLIGQSTDGSTAAIAASGRFDFTLTTANLVTASQAPFGYLWVAFSATYNTTGPSLVTSASTIATACQYQWFTNTLNPAAGGVGFCITSGSSVAGTAPATLIGASAKTVAPVVFLT